MFFAKELDKISDTLAKQLVKQLLILADNPYPQQSRKLQGNENYRLRIGS